MSKRKYLVLFRMPAQTGPGAAPPAGAPSPEAMQQMFAAYQTWMDQFKDHLVDLGDKLRPGGKQLRAGQVVDGPYIESKELIGGYMIVAAEDWDGAMAVVKACPAAQMPGGVLEVRELAGAKM